MGSGVGRRGGCFATAFGGVPLLRDKQRVGGSNPLFGSEESSPAGRQGFKSDSRLKI